MYAQKKVIVVQEVQLVNLLGRGLHNANPTLIWACIWGYYLQFNTIFINIYDILTEMQDNFFLHLQKFYS